MLVRMSIASVELGDVLWQNILALTLTILLLLVQRRTESHSFAHVDALVALVDLLALVSSGGATIESLELFEPLLGRHGFVQGRSMCAPVKADLVAAEEQGTGATIAAFVVVVCLVFLGGYGAA